MLAVGRALLLNGSLVLMDEPSEGLAPTIVDVLVEAVHRLVAEGTAVLVVEQKLRAATAMAERQLVMVSGRIQAETTASQLLADPELQRRYLGVGTAVETTEQATGTPAQRTPSQRTSSKGTIA
jgi:branched-chain amino acid transport system ATP-binding protein